MAVSGVLAETIPVCVNYRPIGIYCAWQHFETIREIYFRGMLHFRPCGFVFSFNKASLMDLNVACFLPTILFLDYQYIAFLQFAKQARSSRVVDDSIIYVVYVMDFTKYNIFIVLVYKMSESTL